MTPPLPSLDSSPAFLLLSAAASDDLPTLKSTLQSHSNLSPNTTSLWYHRSFATPSMAFHHRTPLMVAALHSSTSVLAFLLSLPTLHLDLASPSDSSTALHCAAAVGDSTSLKLLLSSGADPSVPNSSGLLPLHLLPRLRSSQLSPLLGGKEVKKEKEYPVDVTLPDIKSGIFVSDEFRMYSFKVRVCTRAYSHDWTECPFVHPGENARRRDPRKYSYSCVPCLEFRKGSCRNGDACEYAHGVFESWLHPSQYRTRLCKDETSCSRRVCFFAHKPEELRAPVDQTFEIETSSPRKTMALPPLQTGSPVWMDRTGLGTPVRSRLNSTVSARDLELNEFQQQLLDEIRRGSDYADKLGFCSSSGFVHPSSPKLAPSAITRAAAFAKRSQSFIDRGAVGRVASRQVPISANWGSPNGNSEWASPNGKLDWGIQGAEINKLRKSASFGIRSAAAPPGFSRGPTGEPDVSWVQSVLKDGPEFEPRRISNRNRQYGEMFPSWADQLYLEQEQMVA